MPPCGIFYWRICRFWVFTSGVVFASLLEVVLGFQAVLMPVMELLVPTGTGSRWHATPFKGKPVRTHNLLEIGFKPVASVLRAGSLPCELQLVARPTVAHTEGYLFIKRRSYGMPLPRSGTNSRFRGERFFTFFGALICTRPGG